jgi:hypothetical protein
MDFASRDCYRHAVESLARRSGLAETEMAQAGNRSCTTKRGRKRGGMTAQRMLVFTLSEKGLPQLARETGVRRPWRTVIERRIRRFPHSLSMWAGFFW